MNIDLLQPEQQAVWQTEQERIRATIQVDIPVLEHILTDDYFYPNSRGEQITKSYLLEAIQKGAVKYESLELEDVVIRVYGDTAIVTGQLRETGAFEGQAFDERFCFTRIYIRQNASDWRSVAYHANRLPEPEE